MDCSPPGSPIPGIPQARTLEWVAISFSNAWKRKVKVKSLSHVQLLETPWTAAYQAPPSMGFSRWEYWSGVPLPSPERFARVCHNKHHRLSGLNNRFSHSSGGWKLEIKVSAGLVFWSLSLAWRWPPSPSVFIGVYPLCWSGSSSPFLMGTPVILDH